MEHVEHTFAPVYNENSKILILGTFPSVKSRENDFYYGHPQNRFWKVISAITETELPITIEEKKNILLNNKIAVWDVIASCDIIGSSDSSITNVVPNDITGILENSQITKIYVNGGKAYQLYNKYISKNIGIEAIKLPSTSPANARSRLENLIEAWKILKLDIK
ncbi:MAG: DNA-deoxyinosine glycosylase [Sarcina sp.]